MSQCRLRGAAGVIALVASLLFLTGAIGAGAQQAPPPAGPDLVWPNRESKANSDDWIRLHHSQIRQMQPRLLVLNFVNGLSTEQATQQVNRVIAAIREATRYHGYKNPNAPPFLDYQIYKVVDLTDPQSLPDDIRMEGNSSKYPRVTDWKAGLNFRYEALFSPEFAQYYQIPDPANTVKMLTLSELVSRGIVHEVWFLGLQGQFGAPYETVEVKQAYDRTLHKLPGRGVQAGIDGTPEQPFIGRSLRILYINSERGPGTALQSLGRSIEAMAASGAIPYFSRYFAEYAGFDLKQRYHLPFNSFYEREGNDLGYPERDTLTYTWKGEKRAVHPYIAIGGNVHFMPTAHRDFDLNNPDVVLSTIEHYRLHDDLTGKDRAEPWHAGKFTRYRTIAPDGQGPWVVYWGQNMPGLDNACKDDGDKPMLNWWPFLFY